MDFTSETQLSSRKRAGGLVIPFFQKNDTIEIPKGLGSLSHYLKLPIESKDFKAKEGEVVLVYMDKEPESRLLLLGLGNSEKVTLETYRRAYASLGKFCISRQIDSLNIFLPQKNMLRGALEGILLVNYAFDVLKSDPIKSAKLIEAISLIGFEKKDLKEAQKILTICQGVYFARDLTNGNADDITPQFIGEIAQGLAKKYASIKTTVFDKARIEKEGMGLLLGVNQGSSKEPAFIISEYKGNPKSSDLTVYVGKGITYDTGGLNLKPTGGMETMRADMGAAAVGLAVLKVIAELGLKVNLTVVIPSTENCIGSKSIKPGDVCKSYTGKMIEIANTDAEGRLVLADALGFAVENFNPTRLIDFGTLTGAIDVALGPEAAGLFSDDEELVEAFQNASKNTFERVWRMPLFQEYRDNLKSEIADMKNVGARSGGACNAAAFLKEFVKNTPWLHLDIASVNYGSESRRYHPKMATGFGVRLMVEFLEHLVR